VIRPALLYDGQCRFCRAAAALVRRWSRGCLAILPFTHPAAESVLEAIPFERRLSSIHVAQPDGTVESGGRAVTTLLETLPGAGVLTRAARRWRRVQSAIDAVYEWVSRHRGTFGRFVPDRGPTVVVPALRQEPVRSAR